MRLLVSILALAAATSAVHAADLIVHQPAISAPSASASGMKGVVELGALGTFVSQTDSDFDGRAAGGYASGALWGSSGVLVWGIDGYIDANTFANTDDEAPTYVGLVGGHLGFDTGSGSVGGFASVGFAPNDVDDAHVGYTVGIEGIAHLSNISLFAQLGYGSVRVEDDWNGFTGPFGRIGAVFALSDDMAVMADVSAGAAGVGFEDSSGDGTIFAAGVKAAFALPTDFAAFLTVGYEYAHYQANTEDDGSSHTVKVGLSIPFGDGNTAADALNPLATSALPYRAASWGATLD